MPNCAKKALMLEKVKSDQLVKKGDNKLICDDSERALCHARVLWDGHLADKRGRGDNTKFRQQ